jgi:hypothetical protein
MAMAGVNSKRVLIGGVVGGLAWLVWGVALNFGVLMSRYAAAAAQGTMLKEPRYPVFIVVWAVTLIGLGLLASWLYANVRATMGPGPKTAIKVGLALGFAAGFPANYYVSTWVPFSRVIPLGWLVELGVGAVMATLVAAWLYRET